MKSALNRCCRDLSTVGGEGGEPLRKEAEGGATVRDRSTEERRNEAVRERARRGGEGLGKDERPCRLL